uniref:Uncharacterized protein n=1 Tax=Rhizophora mucronata TaxID=61149 RepID=A0A2P2N082_RHIMU
MYPPTDSIILILAFLSLDEHTYGSLYPIAGPTEIN